MRLGPDYVYQCPDCGEKVLQMDVQSVYSFGCSFYSDQRMDGPMFYSPAPICRCKKCNHIYWLDHRNQTGSYPVLSEAPEKEAIPRAETPTLKDYFDAIHQKAFHSKMELTYLRKKIWQTGNRLLASKTPLPSGCSRNDLLQNMQELYLLVPDINENHKLMKAELARNMGDFESCRELLDYIIDREYEETTSRILDECFRENTETILLWEDEISC